MSKVTSTDIAKMAGVSQTTVSAVLNNSTKIRISEETKKKVLEAAHTLGYLKNKIDVSKKVIVMVPTMTNPFYPTVIHYLSEILSDKDLDFVLCCTNKQPEKEEKFIKRINPLETLGIIYTFTPSDYDSLDGLSKSIPIVILGEANYANAVTVALDSYNSGYILAKHLYEKGHRRVAFVSGPINAVSLSRKLRLNGVVDFFAGVGLKECLHTAVASRYDENLDEIGIGYRLSHKTLTENKEITAIIAVNDITAIGAINAIKDLGLSIPQNIAVASFDNIDILKGFTPALTTIDHCLKERCNQAVEILLNGSSSSKITYAPNLIVRASTM